MLRIAPSVVVLGVLALVGCGGGASDAANDDVGSGGTSALSETMEVPIEMACTTDVDPATKAPTEVRPSSSGTFTTDRGDHVPGFVGMVVEIQSFANADGSAAAPTTSGAVAEVSADHADALLGLYVLAHDASGKVVLGDDGKPSADMVEFGAHATVRSARRASDGAAGIRAEIVKDGKKLATLLAAPKPGGKTQDIPSSPGYEKGGKSVEWTAEGVVGEGVAKLTCQALFSNEAHAKLPKP